MNTRSVYPNLVTPTDTIGYLLQVECVRRRRSGAQPVSLILEQPAHTVTLTDMIILVFLAIFGILVSEPNKVHVTLRVFSQHF